MGKTDGHEKRVNMTLTGSSKCSLAGKGIIIAGSCLEAVVRDSFSKEATFALTSDEGTQASHE